MPKRLNYLLTTAVAALTIAAVINLVLSPTSTLDKVEKHHLKESGVVLRISLKNGSQCGVCATVADTYQKRETGLSGVKSLENYDGMLFPLSETLGTSFWMKGVYFPIDLLFFKRDGTFISHQRMPTCQENTCELFPVPQEAFWGLELPASQLSLPLKRASRLEITDKNCLGYLLAGSLLSDK
jgi:uncharacterized membrane protein (UPF0127 family)